MDDVIYCRLRANCDNIRARNHDFANQCVGKLKDILDHLPGRRIDQTAFLGDGQHGIDFVFDIFLFAPEKKAGNVFFDVQISSP